MWRDYSGIPFFDRIEGFRYVLIVDKLNQKLVRFDVQLRVRIIQSSQPFK